MLVEDRRRADLTRERLHTLSMKIGKLSIRRLYTVQDKSSGNEPQVLSRMKHSFMIAYLQRLQENGYAVSMNDVLYHWEVRYRGRLIMAGKLHRCRA